MQKYYVTEALGDVQHVTPEGYLLCVGVPIARTGTQDYRDGEIEGVESDASGMIRVERPESVVFSDATIASFEGKPFTVDHPDEDVGVNNWSDLACGVAQNIRRGVEDKADLLIADIMVTRPEAIDYIKSGIREISCGYDADYLQVEPGRARVQNIIGNHIALVARGRAGSRCAIKDKAKGVHDVEKKDEKGFVKRILDSLTGIFKDEGIVLKIEGEGGDPLPKDEKTTDEPAPASTPGSHDENGMGELKTLLAAILQKLEGGTADKDTGIEKEPAKDEETTPPEGDPKKTTDAVRTVDAVAISNLRSGAEILCPGFEQSKLTHDSKDSVIDSMRSVLDKAYADNEAVRRDIFGMAGGAVRSFKALDAAKIETMFRGAVLMAKTRNNHDGVVTAKDFGGSAGNITAADQAEINNKYWKREE